MANPKIPRSFPTDAWGLRTALILILAMGGLAAGDHPGIRLGWQGLPKEFRNAEDWRIAGQTRSGLWFYLRQKGQHQLECRDQRNQFKKRILLPEYLGSHDYLKVVESKGQAMLLFDLYNAERGEHGFFAATLPADSSSLGQPVLLTEVQNLGNREPIRYQVISDPLSSELVILHTTMRAQSLDLRATVLNSSFEVVDTLIRSVRGFGDNPFRDLFWEECYDVRRVGPRRLGLLFDFKDQARDRKPAQQGLVLVDWQHHQVHAFELKAPTVTQQILELAHNEDSDSVLVYGFATGSANRTPVATLCYGFRFFGQEPYPLDVRVTSLGSDFIRQCEQLTSVAKASNVRHLPELHLQSHRDRSATLAWRRRFRSSETLVQYSQGMPIYREIVRHHAEEWVLARYTPDGILGWKQIIPMNLTMQEPGEQLESQSLVLGPSVWLTGYQSLNNRVRPFAYKIQADGAVYNGDLEGRLDDLFISWRLPLSSDPNTSLFPSRRGGREGLLYLHQPTR
ncbi:MAG: hypothetical protein ACKO17_04235 [Bacteroidota bacterium]